VPLCVAITLPRGGLVDFVDVWFDLVDECLHHRLLEAGGGLDLGEPVEEVENRVFLAH
jgi:hypothetical protein